jgi:hypothetical protein
LAALCLVNRTFNTAISPVLHRELRIGDHVAQPSSRHHNHVRSLVVSSGADDPKLEGIVLGLLPNMPRLESFTQVTQATAVV